MLALNHVNHRHLFSTYDKLSSPGIGILQDEDLEVFLASAFRFRNFVKPNVFLAVLFDIYPPEYVVLAYADCKRIRKEHVSSLWRLLRDMEQAKIPPSLAERRNLVFKTFFRDSPDLTNRVRELVYRGDHDTAETLWADLEGPAFDWETYKDVLALFGKDATDPSVLDTLLFTSMRHNNHDAVADLLQKYPDHRLSRLAVRTLLERLALTQDKASYAAHLQYLVEHPDLLEIRLLNVVIKGMVQLGMVSEAQALTTELNAHSAENGDQPWLRQVGIQDKLLYERALDHASEHNLPHSLRPTSTTFLPFFKYWADASQPFEEVEDLIGQVERAGLSLSAQQYQQILRGFLGGHRTEADLHYVLSRMAASPAQDLWIKERIHQLALPDALVAHLDSILDAGTSPNSSVPADADPLRLLQNLLKLVFLAARRTFDERGVALTNEIEQALSSSKSLRSDVWARGKTTYLRRTALLKMLDLAASQANERGQTYE